MPGEEKLLAKGVSFCAVCDGAFYKGKKAAVIGGGDTALDDALYLSDICEQVYLIHRRAEFRGAEKPLIFAYSLLAFPGTIGALVADRKSVV